MTTNRRDVLKSGGLAALIGVTGLAGCSGGGLLGDGNDAGKTSWQYDPSSLVEAENKLFGSLDYAQIYENRDYLPESSREDYETDSDSPVSAEDIGQMTGVGAGRYTPAEQSGAVFGSVAVTGEFGKDAITGSIGSESEAEKVGEYEGYVLYENAESVTGGAGLDPGTQASATVGVGDGAIVMGVVSQQQTDVGVTGEDAVRKMIDASNGNAPLLRDNSEYASQVSSEVGGKSMRVGGEVDPDLVATMQQATTTTSAQFFQGIRAAGFGATIDGETTTFTFTGVYKDGETAKNTGIVGLVNASSEQAVQESEGIDRLTASRNDGAISIEMEGQTKAIFAEDGPAGGAGSTFSL
jgi:hypothetical protein